MSLGFDWSLLSDEAVVRRFKTFLNSQIRRAITTSFLKKLEINELDFGTIPPEVAVENVREPLPEFYFPAELNFEDSTTSDSTTPNPQADEERDRRNNFSRKENERSVLTGVQDFTEKFNKDAVLGSVAGEEFQKSNFLFNYSAETPTGESEDSRSLNSAFSWTSPKGLAKARKGIPLEGTSERQNRHSMLQEPVEIPNISTLVTFDTTSEGDPPNKWFSKSSDGDGSHQGETTAYSKSVTEDDAVAMFLNSVKDPRDFQIDLSIKYSGDMRILVLVEFSVNSIIPEFLSLQARFTLSQIVISGMAMISFIGDRINFCFAEPPADETSIIKSIKVESEVGSTDKQVLKNLDHIEKFVLENIRKVIDEHLVFPNNHSIIIS